MVSLKQLILSKGNNNLIYRFVPTPIAPPLLGTKWSGNRMLFKLTPNVMPVHIGGKYQINIRFQNGIVWGTTTCRSFTG